MIWYYDEVSMTDMNMHLMQGNALDLIKHISDAKVQAAEIHQLPKTVIQVHATSQPEYLRANL